jgi:two-component system phosphate regulon sensor histidine kinase PhoR
MPLPSSSSPSGASATSATPTRWKRRLLLQLLGPALAALVGVLLTAGPYISVTLERHQVESLADRLLAETRLAAEALPWSAGPALDAACARLAGDLRLRLTVIAPDGRVLGESTRSSAGMDDHADRPEVRGALAHGSARSVRPSATAGGDTLIYVAWHQRRGAEARVVRASLPFTAVVRGRQAVRDVVLAGILAGALIGLLAALLISRRMLRRIQRLVGFAQRLAAGESAPYLAPERPDALGLLETHFAVMAGSVATTIGELRLEQERMEAILRGMVEGVLVTDLAARVVLLNARARALLGVPEGEGQGRALVELVRDPALHELARELRDGAAVVSRDITLHRDAERTLQVNAARLSAADGRAFGFVLVLHDVTELRRLEVVRRDFVANVSHELRTPLTAIKGYAETLLGPAGDDRQTARRFLEVIDRHSERLGRLTDDLLTLSDLELGRAGLRVSAVDVEAAVDDVVQILAERAARADVRLRAEVASGTPAIGADGDRLRQVLINLVDNAVKYTPAGGGVTVRAGLAAGGRPEMVEIRVEDTGMGIPAQDLPRLTERFFRVDKARSRAQGGTGLGLAIVKHIVHAHGGQLEIASAVGRGTTVRVTFPLAGPDGGASALPGRGAA